MRNEYETNSNGGNSYLENTHVLSNTQKINKPHHNNTGSVSTSYKHEDGKLFLNNTINTSNYNSNGFESKNV